MWWTDENHTLYIPLLHKLILSWLWQLRIQWNIYENRDFLISNSGGVYYTVVLYSHFHEDFLILEDLLLTGNVCSI